MTPTAQKAIYLARRGVPVFPCKANKTPCTLNGHNEASTDEHEVAEMFADPAASLIGMPTGAASGISVLDIDPDKGGSKWLFNQVDMPATRTHKTRREGYHFLFKHTEGVRCTADKIAPGVDIRGEGGYVIRWDAAGLPLADDSPLAEIPDWLYQDILAAQGGVRTEMKAPLKPELLAPPSPEAVLCLLANMPNPPETTRGEYIAVNLSVQGAIRGGLATGVLDEADADEIMDAAADWSARWEGPNPGTISAEREKWDADWSQRDNDISGWNTLLRYAGRLGADTSPATAEQAANDFGAAPIDESVAPKPAPQTLFSAKPWGWIEPQDIKPREWIYGRHYIRKYLSATVAPGGLGKSSLALAEALEMVTGRRALTGKPDVDQTYRVLYWCGEDPMDELDRRMAAACLHYGVTRDEIADRLYLVSGRDSPLRIAEGGRDGLVLNKAAIQSLKDTIKAERLDVVMVDPFVTMHTIEEKDNTGINAIMDVFRQIADECNCAIELIHHTRKTNSSEGKDTEMSADDARGASALVSAARSVRVLQAMSKDTAAKAGVPEEARRRYFRVDNGKANLAPPAAHAVWRHLADVDLGNGRGRLQSDRVGVVEAWTMPVAAERVTAEHLEELAFHIEELKKPSRKDAQSVDWIGHTLGSIIGEDSADKAVAKRLKADIDELIKRGVLEAYQSRAHGRSVECVRVPGQ